MCGIIAEFKKPEKKKKTNELIANQYQEQINRGEEGFGLISINNKSKIATVKRAVKDSKILLDLYQKENENRSLVFHHRLPSSSRNEMSQTHPMEVESGTLKYKYLVIHNGIINNAKERFEEQEKELGFSLSTRIDGMTNDSEALAIDIAMFIEEQTEKIKATGSAAFIALQLDIETNKVINIFFGRNSANPLKLAMKNDEITLSSEGKGNNIKINTLYSFNLDKFKLKKKAMTISQYKTFVKPKTINERVEENKRNYEIYKEKGQKSLNHTNTMEGYGEEIEYHLKTKEKENKDIEKRLEIEENRNKQQPIGYNTDEEFENKFEIEDIIDETTEALEKEMYELISKITDKDTIFSLDLNKELQTFLKTSIKMAKELHEEAKEDTLKEIMEEEEIEKENIIF